jgi:hypothetical protein
MFIDWDDVDWCEFDNYMLRCLQGYLDTGLVKTEHINLNVRKLSAETCHEFIEWCGLIGDEDNVHNIQAGVRLYKNDLYYKFVDEYPDYGPKAKMTISRTKFYKWLVAYALFKEGIMPDEGRDQLGRWIIIRTKEA